MKKIAIVGAGPAGLYCALHLQELGDFKIDIFEKNSPLKTLLVTGNGRCNLAHYGDDIKEFAKNYPRGEKFLYSIFSKHFVYDSLDFFEKIGIKTYMQEDMRFFPESNSASDMRKKMLEKFKGTFIYRDIFDINSLKSYDYIVLSTGSKGGYELAKQIGHNIIEPKPALCGLKIKNNGIKYPQGVSVKTKQGDIMFTKEGITGPLIYTISSLRARENFPYYVVLDIIDFEELFCEVKENPKKSFGNIVSKFIPKSLAQAIMKNYDAQCGNIKKSEIEEMTSLKFEIISTDGKGEVVTSGGVDLKEIDKNCQSKINPKYFFCGELMDIDGLCGGFNLQNCWSSAYVVANGIANLD